MGEFKVNDGQMFVFTGDSITDCGCQGDFQPYGQGYARLAIDLITARYPDRRIRYVNAGVGGNTVADLDGRWEDDVLSPRPDWLSVMIGINDCHLRMGGRAELAPPQFEATYRRLLQRAKDQCNPNLVLLDPFYICLSPEAGSWEARMLHELPGYLAAVEKLADEFDALHVRTQDLFLEQLARIPADWFAPEPVHPYLSGHVLIAHGLLRALDW